MTKVGEGKFQPPQKPNPEAELKRCAGNFKEYLNQYDRAKNTRDKTLINDKMESELSLMDVAANGASKKEVRVQEQKVAEDFMKFRANPTGENRAALEQDIDTLNESLEK